MGGSPSTQKTTEQTKQQTQQQQQTSGTSAQQYSGQTAGTTAQQEQATKDVTLPDYLKSFVPGAIDVSGNALQNFAQQAGQYQLPPETLAGLQSTAGGDYLYGGPAQQAFIDASVRSALPGINSQFEMAGRPGGGLFNAQIAQQAQDAYARLFDAERNRQQQAQQLLPGVTMLPLQIQQQLAQLAGSLPGQFSPFLGTQAAGTTTGQTATSASGQQTGQTTGQSSGTSSSKGTTTTTQPLYQPGPLDYALAGAGLTGGLATTAIPSSSLLGGLLKVV